MKKRIPSSSDYVLCEWKGRDVLDFSQRLFSRELRNLTPGEGRFCLFLLPDGKLRHLFWIIKSTTDDLWLVLVPKAQAAAWQSDIESYQFSEDFKIGEFRPVSTMWEKMEEGLQDGKGKMASENQFIGEFKSTRIYFDWANPLETITSNSESDSDWIQHRILHLIPEPNADFAEPKLVFELGLENYCDSSKGCYVGQEVVERVRSRGGKVPNQLSCTIWNDKILPGDEIRQDQKRIGQLSLSSFFSKHDQKHYALALLRRQIDPNLPIFAVETAAEGRILS